MHGKILRRTIKHRYRFLYMNNKEYLLDLNANKLAFIFPFLYLFTGVKAYEITYEDSKKLGYDNHKPSFWYNAAPGIGVFLGVILRPYSDLFKYEMNNNLSIFIILVIIMCNLLVRLNISKKANVNFKMVNEPIILKIKPRIKDLLIVSLGIIFFGSLIISSIYILLSSEQNILFFIFLFPFIFVFTLIHFSLYRPGSVKVRIFKNMRGVK